MDKKIALVTGSGRGIGRAIAIELGLMGFAVAINYKSSENAAIEVRDIIKNNGGNADIFKADVSDSAQVTGMFKRIYEVMGGAPLVLVNNAGITRDNLLMRMKDEEWLEVVRANLDSTYYCTHEAIRGMIKARWGRIINIASVVGLIGSPGQSNYCATKAGIIGFTKSIAREYGAKGITSNAIAPGFIETDMTNVLKDDLKTGFISQIPCGRAGKPEEVGKAAAFFASENASYISGQVLAVDGGLTMCS